MFYLINHNSYILFAVIFWVGASVFALKKMPSPANYLLIIGFGLLLIFLFSIVRPKQENLSNEISIEKQIGTGQVVLLELQSPY